jgi:hypothetical protein
VLLVAWNAEKCRRYSENVAAFAADKTIDIFIIHPAAGISVVMPGAIYKTAGIWLYALGLKVFFEAGLDILNRV